MLKFHPQWDVVDKFAFLNVADIFNYVDNQNMTVFFAPIAPNMLSKIMFQEVQKF